MTHTANKTQGRKYNKGYTTVELIIVIVLIMLLAGGLIFGAVKWVENIRFRRQNEYARTIFVAAQNQLTEYSESGQLEKMQKKLYNARGEYDNENLVKANELLDGEGKAYDLTTLWPESKDSDSGASEAKYRGEIYSLKGTPGDYAKYKARKADKKTEVLYDLLSSYLYDTSILEKGVVCLEFTPEDGQVFAALYSDIANNFTYDDTINRTGTVSIYSRETSYRKKRMVGYYGVDTLYKATSTKMEKPAISSLRLNNEDTLNLSFQIGKVKAAVNQLQYEVTVYEKNGKARLMFHLDGTKLKNKGAAGGNIVKCEITRYQYGTGTDGATKTITQKLGEYPILAWMEEDGGNPVVRIVLDGADQAATTMLYQQAFNTLTVADEEGTLNGFDSVKGTQSFRRFGLLGVEDIYCTVRGEGNNYKPTAKKQSNTENAAFAQASLTADLGETKVTYTLKNARHLYNVRYLEDYTANDRKDQTGEGTNVLETRTLRSGEETVQVKTPHMDGGTAQYASITYQLGADIDWNAFVEGGSLFEFGTVQKSSGGDTQFPSIRQLRSTSTLQGNSRQDYTISGLVISASGNKKAGVYRTVTSGVISTTTENEAKLSVGLFVKNEGKIDQVSLDRITVDGGTDVGAFCGQNKGILKNLRVKNTGKESGKESRIRGIGNVGGIAGSQVANADESNGTALTGLVNYARVTERIDIDLDSQKAHQNFGGIVGCLKTDSKNAITVLQVKDCENYGVVAAAWVQKNRAVLYETENIGGITGSAVIVENNHKVEIINCISSPQYTSAEIRRILSDESTLEQNLYGKYVGGIVGYNNGGSLVNCNTKKESKSKEGYVIGGERVGGIIGYNDEAMKATVDGMVSGRYGVNEAHVLGRKYVGGIVGGNPNGTVTHWENKGFAAATEAYAGGIAGYNGVLPEEAANILINKGEKAAITDCSSEVANTAAVQQLSSKEELFKADYVGGVSGYNNADINANKEISLVSNVTGANFVGGVTGYNDVDAVVKNYSVVGGYINATGTYVGGFCGLNTSIRLLEDENGNAYYVRSNPNLVKGGFCVGGVIGGNIVPVPSGRKTVSCSFAADNFLGKLEASGAYAGGYVGCNWMIQDAKDIRERIQEAAEQSAENCSGNVAVDQMARVEELLVSNNFQTSNCTFIIDGVKRQSYVSAARFGGITAKIYAGSVIGCNQPDTKLEIKNVENKTPVTATASVAKDSEQPGRKDYQNREFRYSYAGGIIGKVTKNVILDNCRNQDSGSVTSKGTYTGGLCEINEGKIVNCTASSLGSSKKDYVGGIVGLNKNGAEITGCKLESGRTITGRNIVGGIAAENFGEIDGTAIRGNIRSYGTYGRVGGVTAYNSQNGSITLETTVSSELNVRIQASGDYVGGVAGENSGTLTGSQTGDAQVTVAGAVSGRQYVGGIVGKNNTNKKIKKFTNKASVTAERSYAGGIAGETSGNISDCHNEGTVTARQTGILESNGVSKSERSGYAGGIVAKNTGTISGCTDTGAVSAPNGMCGGIAAVNGVDGQTGRASIADCRVYSAYAGSWALTFIGKDRAGGICAVNGGDIESSSVYGIKLNDMAGSKDNLLGGITAENKAGAKISGCMAGKYKTETTTVTKPVEVVSLTTGASAGGAAGRNEGEITDTTVQANLLFTSTDMAYYGNLGGVAGENLGTLEDCAFSGKVTGTANSPQNPPQYDPTKDAETSGAVIYGYGGIAGVNGSSAKTVTATITDCKVSDAEITGIGDATNVTNVGGIAGVNGKGAEIQKVSVGAGDSKTYKMLSSTANSYINKATGYNVHVYVSAYGHTGGVAGMNSGRIQSVEYTSGRNAKQQDAPGSSVAVESFRGHVGGIAGYNRRSGLISEVQTGEGWTVYAPDNAQDNGCGGIIGYQAGEGSLTDCVNRAKVVKTINSSNGVGGMIGRMEVATARNYLIQNCVNYGDLYGAARVGGMIGVAKYYGGTVSKCMNYGEITAVQSGIAAGMVGHLYGIKPEYGAFTITGCQNHGTVNGGGGFAAGMIAYSSGTGANAEVHLADCVNTGYIKGGTIAGISSLTQSISGNSTVIRCRNYGYAANKNMGGILEANAANKIKVQDCFGISNLICPVAPAGALNTSSGSNYYVTSGGDKVTYYDGSGKETTAKPETFYVKRVEASSTIQDSANLHKVVADRTNINDSTDKRAWYNTQNQNRSYTFTFSKAIDLSVLTLYWNDQGGTREQDYTIAYSTYTSGENFEDCYTKNNTKESGCAPSMQEITLGSIANEARRIRITVTKSRDDKDTKDVNACLIRAYFRGKDHDTKTEIDYQGQLTKINNTYTAMERYLGLTHSTSGTVVTYTGLPYETRESAPSAAVSGEGYPASVENADEGGYKLVHNGVQVGRAGFKMDPYEEYKNASQDALKDNSLKVKGKAENNIRYRVFEADDDYFRTTLTGVTSLTTPDVPTLQSSAGGVTMSWGPVEYAQYYEYEVTYYDGENPIGTRTDTVYGTNVEIPITEMNGVKVTRIQAKVRAGADTDTEKKQIWSAWSGDAKYDVKNALPTPKFHLELVLVDSQLTYKAFLDNQEEYRQFLRDNGVADAETELGNITVAVSLGGQTININVKNAVSDSMYAGNDTGTIITAYAKHTQNIYGQSTQTMRESQAFRHITYTAPDKFATVCLSQNDNFKVGFYGDTEDTLQYLVTLSKGKHASYYMRTEMTAVDAGLGVPVSVSSSEVRISDTTTTATDTRLVSLPADLMDGEKYSDIALRSYPSLMSNNVVYNGHDVALPENLLEASQKQGLTKEQLKELLVTADGYVAEGSSGSPLIDNDGKLAAGYVVQLLPDGSYSLFYNALLHYNEKTGNSAPSQGNKTQMKTQVYTYDWSVNERLEKQNAPVIKVNADADGKEQDPNADQMVITWDLNQPAYYNEKNASNYEVGAVYDYTVTGYTESEESVQIITGQYTTSAAGDETNTSGPNRLTLDTTGWKYKKVEIVVSRRGKTGTNGKTTNLPNGSRKEVPLKLSLSQVEAPTLSLHAVDGVVQKNALDYDVTWANIPEVERSELRAYEITAVRNEADTAARAKFETNDALVNEWNRLNKLYNEKAGRQAPDTDTTNGGRESGKAVWTWTSKENGMDVTRRMELVLDADLDEDGLFITKELTATWVKPVTEAEKNAEMNEITTFIDLSDYERGEALSVSVRALAVENAQTYRNGPAGVAAEMTLPSRLDVPVVTTLQAKPGYKTDEFIFITQIEDEGLTLTYRVTDNSVDEDTKGSYQLAIAVFENASGDRGDKAQISADDWKNGAIDEGVLFDKSSPAVMDGSLTDASYTLKGLQRTYGGMWLKVVMRSVSDNNVSSWWSDEDAAAEETVNYQWIQIPRVQEETMSLEKGSSDLEYVYVSENESYEYTDGQHSIPVTQTTMSWKQGQLADHYKISIVRNQSTYAEEDTTYEGYTTRLTDWIYLQKSETGSGFDVFYQSSDPEFNPESLIEQWKKKQEETGITVPSLKDVEELGYADAVYIGSISEDRPCILPWKGTAIYKDGPVDTPVQTVSWIALENDKITLQLPDVEQIETDETAATTETDQIEVQAVIDNSKKTRYEDSNIRLLHRVNNVFNEEELELSRISDEPASDGTLSVKDGHLQFAMDNTIQDAWLISRVQVKDANGQVLKTRYVSSYGSGTGAITNYILLPLDLWMENSDAANSITIDVAKIDVTGKGISKWSTYVFDTIPNPNAYNLITQESFESQQMETDRQTESEQQTETGQSGQTGSGQQEMQGTQEGLPQEEKPDQSSGDAGGQSSGDGDDSQNHTGTAGQDAARNGETQ